jgi:hypothetical protein
MEARAQTHSYENRILHGEEGKGRFRTLALGRVAEWNVTVPSAADPSAALVTYTITIVRDSSRHATISDVRPAPGSAKRAWRWLYPNSSNSGRSKKANNH